MGNRKPMSQKDRDRGVLTPADREFLTGERELSDQSAYNARVRIRNRVRNALLDFEILFNELSERDRERIFGPMQKDLPRYELPDGTPIKSRNGISPPISWAMVDAVAFLYEATIESYMSFKNLIEAGVWQAHPKHHSDRRLVDVTVNIEDRKKGWLVENALSGLERGNAPSAPQLAALMESEDVTDNQILKARELIKNDHRTPRRSPKNTILTEIDDDTDDGES